LQAQPLGWAVEVRGPPRLRRGGGAGEITPLAGTPAYGDWLPQNLGLEQENCSLPFHPTPKISGGHYLYAISKPLWTRTLDLDVGLAIMTKELWLMFFDRTSHLSQLLRKSAIIKVLPFGDRTRKPKVQML
jgi:hypothetical protein